MNKKDVNKIQPGIYRIHWKAGGESLAAVGIQGNGDKWLAPLNWVAPTTDLDPWKKVKSVEVVILYKDYQDEKENGFIFTGSYARYNMKEGRPETHQEAAERIKTYFTTNNTSLPIHTKFNNAQAEEILKKITNIPVHYGDLEKTKLDPMSVTGEPFKTRTLLPWWKKWLHEIFRIK